MYCTGLILCQGGLYEIEKDAVTFEMPDADFVAKFGMQAATDMVLDFHCFHPQLPFLYDARQLAAFLSTSRQKLLYYARHTAAAYHPVTIPKRNGAVRTLSVPDDTLRHWQRKICRDLLAHLPVAPQATAYRKGGTLSGNAAPHVGKRYLLKLDISDFSAVSALNRSTLPPFIPGTSPGRWVFC